MTLYALKDKAGDIKPFTLATNRRDVWAYGGFDAVCKENPGFRERYWKRWDESLRSARRKGYRVVAVQLVEA